MKRRNKIIIFVVLLVALIGVGVGLYFNLNQGPIVGHIEFGNKYFLSEIRPTKRFEGATMNSGSYFQINHDRQTGNLHLVGLTGDTDTISFIVTSYKEGVQHTTIEFEYIVYDGNDTKIHRLQAISTNTEIRIKAVEPHGIQTVISQNPEDIDYLDYSVTILVFRKGVTEWNVA